MYLFVCVSSHVSCTSSLAQKVGAESASHVHCRFMVASNSSQCDVSSACESQMAREGLVRMFMVESRQIGFPPNTVPHFNVAFVKCSALSFRCNCVLRNEQGACEKSVCHLMIVLACQRNHIACSSQSSPPLFTTCDVPCFLCVWYVERSALAFDGRAMASAICVCVWEFGASLIVQGALATSVCHWVLCVRSASWWRTCFPADGFCKSHGLCGVEGWCFLLCAFKKVRLFWSPKIVLWWCGFAPRPLCGASKWCPCSCRVGTFLWFGPVSRARSFVEKPARHAGVQHF